MNDNFVILPEYKLAIESLKKNPVTVIFGNAGSGKSTFINYIKNKIRNTLLLAPTGIAALNIGGKTIHSVCKLPPYYINKSDIKRLPNVQRQFLCNLNLIIIDEISMVSSNLLDALDDFLRMNRGIFKPFGGVHILLVGDLFQLPPIVDNKYDFKKYKSELFFDSMVIQNLIQVTTKSKNIPQDYIQITPYNDISDITNKRKLDEINLPIKTYFGKVSGKFNTNNCIVPQALSLKVGAQVMICKNNKKLGLVNGQIGKVLALNDESVKVDFGNGKIENITSELWEEFSLPNKDGKTKVSGSFVQIPLKLAWSITIHKSQSATIEKLYIDMDRGAFAPGMLYVALSRAKSLKGLILSKDILMEDVIVDQRCIDFFQSF
jgi:hypothetical protein